jgi:hypothetical protein
VVKTAQPTPKVAEAGLRTRRDKVRPTHGYHMHTTHCGAASGGSTVVAMEEGWWRKLEGFLGHVPGNT